MIRPELIMIGATALAGACILIIPVPKPSPNFTAIAATHPQPVVSDAAKHAVATPQATRWSELMPRDWDPHRQLRDMQKGSLILWDSSPRAAELLKGLRELWDNAPVNPALDGATVRLPGYVVPLDQNKQGVKAFLLVPYFGACIHSPPPPSNQVIHVRLSKPLAGMRAMDTIWVNGRLKIERSESSVGVSSYGLDASLVEPYTAAKRD